MTATLAQQLYSAKIICAFVYFLIKIGMFFFLGAGIYGMIYDDRRLGCLSMAAAVSCGFLLAVLPDLAVWDRWIDLAGRP